MRHDPLYFAFDIHCPSVEEADRLREMTSLRSAPEALARYQVTGGGETREVTYRMGDYFAQVQIVPALGGNPRAFRIVFSRHPQAGRFWKDLMIHLIADVQKAGAQVSAELTYKGDECLDWTRPQLTEARKPTAGPVAPQTT